MAVPVNRRRPITVTTGHRNLADIVFKIRTSIHRHPITVFSPAQLTSLRPFHRPLVLTFLNSNFLKNALILLVLASMSQSAAEAMAGFRQSPHTCSIGHDGVKGFVDGNVTFNSVDGQSRVHDHVVTEIRGIKDLSAVDDDVILSLCPGFLFSYIWIAGCDRQYFANRIKSVLATEPVGEVTSRGTLVRGIIRVSSRGRRSTGSRGSIRSSHIWRVPANILSLSPTA